MRLLRFIAIVGLFALAGVGLAAAVIVSEDAPAKRTSSAGDIPRLPQSDPPVLRHSVLVEAPSAPRIAQQFREEPSLPRTPNPAWPAGESPSLLRQPAPEGAAMPEAPAASGVIRTYPPPSDGKPQPDGAKADDALAIDMQDADIRDVLLTLSEQGKLNILVNESVQGKVSGSLRGVDVRDTLEAVLRSTGFASRRQGNFILVGKPEELDDASGKLQTRFYQPGGLSAERLQELVERLLTPELGSATIWREPAPEGAGGSVAATPEMLLVRDRQEVLGQVDALMATLAKSGESASEPIVTRVYRPNLVSAADLIELVRPMLTPQVGEVRLWEEADGASAENAGPALPAARVLVRDYESALSEVDVVVKEVNEPPASEEALPPDIIQKEGDDRLTIEVANQDIRAVLSALSEYGGMSILASQGVQGQVSATLHGVTVEGALDAVLKLTGLVSRREGSILYVGTSEEFAALEEKLDRQATRVYRPNYVSAMELNTLITPLLSKDIGVATVSSAAEKGIAADDSEVGGDQFAGGDVVVVRDYEAVLAQVDQLVAEIDVRPTQVAIEAMILAVKLDDSLSLGVDFEILRQQQYLRFGWGTPLSSLDDDTFQYDGGLKIGFLDSNLGAFLNALETMGDTNVIATPRVMVLNKQRAEILIGEKLGYVNTTMTETSSSQSVEFLEVGAQLRIRPFIGSDGVIRMEVHPELSSGSVQVEEGFTLPNKELTEVTTNVMVRDGCTVVIGGLIRDELNTTGNQVPLLGSLPVVGAAFRTKTEETLRREIIVLITPHIVYDPDMCEEGAQGACEFQRRQAAYADHMSPLGKRHLGRKYLRLAQQSRACGHSRAALRFADMAVGFDPLNLEAIELQSTLRNGCNVCAAAPTQPATHPMDGTTMADWLLDDLAEPQQAAPAAPQHPLDRGQPGYHRDLTRPRILQ